MFSGMSTYSPPVPPIHLQDTYINDKQMNLHFCTSMEHVKLSRRNRFCWLKEAALFLFVLGVISRIYKTKKILFLGMYKYTFSFTLKLITALLQKITTFYIWNIKQKDDEMDKIIWWMMRWIRLVKQLENFLKKKGRLLGFREYSP